MRDRMEEVTRTIAESRNQEQKTRKFTQEKERTEETKHHKVDASVS